MTMDSNDRATGPGPTIPRSWHAHTCGCGQELDSCTGRHCPRCGTSIVTRAA